MKRILTTLVLLLPVLVQAKPVDPADLIRVAQHVLQRTDVVDITPARFTECRLYTGTDQRGFVLLAADDCSRPLLGYSLDEGFVTDSIPRHVMAWIDGYQRVIASLCEAGLSPAPEVAGEWQRLLSDTVRFKATGRPVGPLLTSRWDQGVGYNDSCPYDSGAHANCLTGCVATAGAQVMYYWKHPALGRGSHTHHTEKYGDLTVHFDSTHYDWEHMGSIAGSTASMSRRRAVAQLIYHYGVAVDMSYTPGGSGANSNPLGNVKRASSETALKEYFRYNPGLFTAYKEGFSDAAWEAMIDEELDAQRPIIYDGYGPSGGHAFVLDGRDEQGLYHFNWGWGGTGNGFFTLDSLSPLADASFSNLNAAIFRIYPIEIESPTVTMNMESADPSRGTVSGSGVYSTDSMRIVLLATAKPGYRFDHWRSGNPANPIITSPTRDLADTAVFVPIHHDSVGYCRNNGIAYKNLTEQDSAEWGIRIPYDYLAGKQRLREVHFWTYEAAGPYHLRLYRGEVPDGEPFYTDSLMATGYGMNIYSIPEELSIDFADSAPLWVTIYSKGSPYPISYSHYTGTPDGSWVRYNGVWQPMYQAKYVYGSWMIRALLDPSTHVGVPEVEVSDINVSTLGRMITVEADSPVSVYDIMSRRLHTSLSGCLRCTLPAAGIYIVRAASSSKKIAIP